MPTSSRTLLYTLFILFLLQKWNILNMCHCTYIEFRTEAVLLLDFHSFIDSLHFLTRPFHFPAILLANSFEYYPNYTLFRNYLTLFALRSFKFRSLMKLLYFFKWVQLKYYKLSNYISSISSWRSKTESFCILLALYIKKQFCGLTCC